MKKIDVAKMTGQLLESCSVEQIEFVDLLLSSNAVKDKGKRYIWDIPVAFDIETTHGENGSYMYVWQMAIGYYPGRYKIVMGRTWDEWTAFMDVLNKISSLYGNTIAIYVHNLSYEYSFFRKILPASKSMYDEYDDVFSVDSRKPVRVVCQFLEFRDSYILANRDLDNVAKNLTSHKIEKLKGSLDYSKKRNSLTPLSDTEIAYCLHDVLILIAYIQEMMEIWGDIVRIPMTSTGCIRVKMREIFRTSTEWKKAVEAKLSYIDYDILRKTFQGGCVVANPLRIGITWINVRSFDITSSYPSVMALEKFPYGTPIRIASEKMSDLSQFSSWACLLIFDNLDFNYEDLPVSIISKHKIFLMDENSKVDLYINGRVYQASGKIGLYCTNIDFETIRLNYNFKSVSVSTGVGWYQNRLLPYDMRRYILSLYADKTTLKGVEGKEREYLQKKEFANGTYGMCVTALVQDDDKVLGGEWKHMEKTIEQATATIERHESSKDKFLQYFWGVWVTAYARRNLYCGMRYAGDNFIYSDTDSIKFLDDPVLCLKFDEYNRVIQGRFKEIYGVEYEALITPMDKKGKRHPLGSWDDEGVYEKFKTIRSKAYLVLKDGKYEVTLAGCGKKTASAYFSKLENPFDAFNLHMVLPPEISGKLYAEYIDEPREEEIKDEYGNTEIMRSETCVNLNPIAYDCSLSIERAILNGIAALHDYRQL